MLERASARVDGRRCRFKGATPLAVLLRTRLDVRLRDYGACSRDPRDATSVYVRGIERDVETRRGGWVYKVGRRVPGSGAGDPAARLRHGQRLLWFWCRSRSGGCQRTLEARPERTSAAPGETLRVTVTGYDDHGRGRPVAGATVTLGAATTTSGPDGVAVITVPPTSGTLGVVASKPGTVRSFPAGVRVG
jgi:hypothetical protein